MAQQCWLALWAWELQRPRQLSFGFMLVGRWPTFLHARDRGIPGWPVTTTAATGSRGAGTLSVTAAAMAMDTRTMIGTGTAAGITTETAIGTMIGIADMTGIATTSAGNSCKWRSVRRPLLRGRPLRIWLQIEGPLGSSSAESFRCTATYSWMYCLNLHTLAQYKRNSSSQQVLSWIYP